MPEAERFNHEQLRDFKYDVFLHHDAPEGLIHVSMRVDADPEELHRLVLRELNFRKRFQVGAYRHIGTEGEHAYEVLFKEPVPHEPSQPYPLSRLILRPSESGTEVDVYGPEKAEHHVAYLLRTVARALERRR